MTSVWEVLQVAGVAAIAALIVHLLLDWFGH